MLGIVASEPIAPAASDSRIEMMKAMTFLSIALSIQDMPIYDECMERGMDPQGYDCSGLAIASICDVLNISTREWPRHLRHTQQLASLAIDATFQLGDLRLYYSANGRIHLGVATSTEKVVHASGLTNKLGRVFIKNFRSISIA